MSKKRKRKELERKAAKSTEWRLNKEVRRLNKEAIRLQQHIAELETELEATRECSTVYLANSRRYREISETQKTELEADNAQMRRTMKGKQAVVDQCIPANEKLHKQVAELEETVAIQRYANNDLALALDKAKAKIAKLDISKRNCDVLLTSHEAVDRRVQELETELEAANITIERIRETLIELLAGRIAGWLNSQGESFSTWSGGHAVKYAKINPPSIRPEFPIQPDDIPYWDDEEKE